MSTLRTRKKAISCVLLLLACGFIAYGAYGLWQRYRATHGPAPVIPAKTITHTTTTPEEIPPRCATHHVPDDHPRTITISSVGIDGCIQQVGVDRHNTIVAPSNVHVAGWYTKSVLPGEQGISIIDGHVSGRYSDAIFGKLKESRAGDSITIERGDGSIKTFEIVDSRSFATEDVMRHMFDPLENVDTQLTLITCDGIYDKDQRSYNDRLLVRAKLVP